jgi:MFS transporter, AAHS family, 4-hydroxybenzoate transporter
MSAMADDLDTDFASPGFARLSLIVTAWASLTMFAEGFEMQLVGYAAPSVIGALHVGKTEFGAIFGAGNAGILCGALLLSAIGDRLGRRRLIVWGVLLFSAFTLAAAYGTSVAALAALRFCAGIGLGGAIPNAIALTAECAPHGKRASRITFLYVTYVLGGAAAGLVASSMIPTFGWPVIFTVGGWGGLVCGIALYFFLPESQSFLAQRDAARSGGAAPAKVPVVALFQGGRLAITLLLWFSYLAALLASQFISNWLPTLVAGTGQSISTAALIGSMYYFGGVAGNIVMGQLADRLGLKMVAIGFLIAAPVTACMGLGAGEMVVLAGATLVVGVMMVGSLNGINAAAGMLYPTAMRSSGVGWMNGIGRVGSIMSPVLGGYLISLDMPMSRLFLLLAAPILLACLFMTALVRTAPRS